MNKEHKRLISELRPYAGCLSLSILCAVINVALTLAAPVLSGRAVDCLAGQGMVDREGLLHYISLLVICLTGVSVSSYLIGRLNNLTAYRFNRRLRERAFESLIHTEIPVIDRHPSGDFQSRIIQDADAVCDGLLLGFSQLFTGVLTIVGTIIFLFSVSPVIALIVVALTPLSLAVSKFITSRTYRFFRAQAADRGALTDFADERISAQKLIRSFGVVDNTESSFNELNNTLTDSSLKATFYSSLPNPSSRAVNNLIYAIVGVAGAYSCLTGRMSVGALTAFLGYAREYAKPFNEITGVLSEMQNAFACAARLWEVIDNKTENTADSGAVPARKQGRIDIEDVCFSYDSDPFMQDLNLNVPPGGRVAIVGRTGSGKTTFVNLLMRFYDADSGRILIDGRNIRDIPLRELRSSFGMVLQETWLFSGTVAENLSMGDENISREAMEEAAIKTRAHDFIRRLKDGYDTELGTDGGSLSQGQKQLLCITRVMLHLPEMLILDEATSSIDTRTELKIRAAFEAMMKGRTTFIVAHRLQTIRNSDIICFMDHGTVAEQGTHSQLLAKGGKYAELYYS